VAKKGKKQPSAKQQEKIRDVFVARPFAGLVDEVEWIALRELVPAATAPLRLTPEYAAKYGEREVTLATILPMAYPALSKADGRILIGLQRHDRSGDVNRDLSVAFLGSIDASHAAGLLHRDRRLVQVFHLVTHGTHHRTQFITMLRLLGIDPPFEAGDFGGWSREQTQTQGARQ